MFWIIFSLCCEVRVISQLSDLSLLSAGAKCGSIINWVTINYSQNILIMCTQRNETFVANMAISQCGKRAGNYLPFALQRLFLEQKVVTLLYTSTFLYNQETSKPFTNYSPYLQGSHFLVKEAAGDKNPVLSGRPFKAKIHGAEWEEGLSGLTQQPPLSLWPAGRESGEIMNGHEKHQGQ